MLDFVNEPICANYLARLVQASAGCVEIILDGNSEYDAHVCSELGEYMWSRHLLASTVVSNLQFIFRKEKKLHVFLHTCSKLRSNVSTMHGF
mgnify:CR=1 FL=1